MDTSPFSGLDEFSLIDDLVALFSFKTDASISFLVGRWSNVLRLPIDREGGEEVLLSSGHKSVFNCVGWLDVHHPCQAHVKTQLRIKIPQQHHHFEAMRTIVQTTLSRLGIPLDETYEAAFFDAENTSGLLQTTDRDGMSCDV
jgi:hypothetical protein